MAIREFFQTIASCAQSRPRHLFHVMSNFRLEQITLNNYRLEIDRARCELTKYYEFLEAIAVPILLCHNHNVSIWKILLLRDERKIMFSHIKFVTRKYHAAFFKHVFFMHCCLARIGPLIRESICRWTLEQKRQTSIGTSILRFDYDKDNAF